MDQTFFFSLIVFLWILSGKFRFKKKLTFVSAEIIFFFLVVGSAGYKNEGEKEGKWEKDIILVLYLYLLFTKST